MFPLRDAHRPARAPLITRLLVLAMAGVFSWQIALAAGLHLGLGARAATAPRASERAFLMRWGTRPRCVVAPGSCRIGIGVEAVRKRGAKPLLRWLAPLVSSAFLHAGILHIAFNAWFLLVFGPAVEDRLGRLGYLLFYAACAVVSALAHVAAQPGSGLPLVGASGAIAGVLGAHFVLLPRSWILSYIPPLWLVPMPSLIFLSLWMGGQIAGARSLLPLALSGVPASEPGVAWAAHIGGFVFGAALAWRFKPWFGKRKRESGARAGRTPKQAAR